MIYIRLKISKKIQYFRIYALQIASIQFNLKEGDEFSILRTNVTKWIVVVVQYADVVNGGWADQLKKGHPRVSTWIELHAQPLYRFVDFGYAYAKNGIFFQLKKKNMTKIPLRSSICCWKGATPKIDKNTMFGHKQYEGIDIAESFVWLLNGRGIFFSNRKDERND